ncbi:tyrosine-type recombinase/integrase [Agrobacterium deltaense]|uniref:tyrosine-type recombinase/integrase n=1 Tax=Agrobacterium deltaense TaxID=1183412 RepID=UPI001C6EC822|nr:site-specific integrase [Agrobacterium deltaense]MBW9074953.1 site-specific integrase [Agrobacterium deltaense]
MATITKRTWETATGQKREAWRMSYTDNGGTRHKEQFPTKKEAEARLKQIIADDTNGKLLADAKGFTIADAVKAYSDDLDRQEELGESTRMYVSNTKRQLEMWIMGKNIPPEKPQIEGLGKIKLIHATTGVFQSHADKLKEAGLSVVLIRRVMGAMARCMKFARGKDMVATNNAKGVTVKGKRGEGYERVTPPAKEELTAILKAAKELPPAWAKQPVAAALRIEFAARTGLRASEQWALKWKHVDLEKGVISVEEAVDAFGNTAGPKTKAGTRTVPMGKALIADLKQWRTETHYPGDDDYVFPDARGGYTRHTNFVKRVWKPILKAAGSETGWHSLRHYFVSRMIESGMQPKALQTIAGHSTLAVTMDRYGHLFPSEDHAAIMDGIEL